MGIIKLKNIKVFSYHGCLIEEGKIGSEYSVDLEIKANLSKSAKTDKLSDTIDYVKLNKIVEEEMAIRAHLLENVTSRIIKRIFEEETKVEYVKVSVSKLNPPIGGDVESVCIEMEGKKDSFEI